MATNSTTLTASRLRVPIRSHCVRGHDLHAPNATYSNGGCKLCGREKHRLRTAGLPPMPKVKLPACQKGHRLDLPGSRRGDGRCRICATAAMARWREETARNRALRSKGATPMKLQPTTEDAVEQSRLCTAILEWDARIENELRAWVRADLIAAKAAHLAEIRGDSCHSRI